jgi:hypothetical protein
MHGVVRQSSAKSPSIEEVQISIVMKVMKTLISYFLFPGSNSFDHVK